MSVLVSNRIEKEIVLHGTKSRVWRALSDAKEFGKWFGVDLRGEFRPGETLKGNLTHEGFRHLTMEVVVEEVDPERRFSFKWHPFAIDPGVDYSKEPMTLVSFVLESVPGGTRLTLEESGFDAIPEARRDKAYEMNSQGWAFQMSALERHLNETP